MGPIPGAEWMGDRPAGATCSRKLSQIAWKDMTMGRKAGDRYTCSECGSTILYEKECPCCPESGHAEVCCDKPMEKVPA
jgi:hypothetical protein